MLSDLSDYIRGEMKRQKITQSDLAIKTGMTQANFSKHLNKTDFDIGEMIEIFNALGTDAERIGELLSYEKR